MMAMISRRGDRAGHGDRRVAGLALLVCLLAIPAIAAAADYSARRFDVVAAVSEAGDLHVKEVIAFDFTSGPYKRVWREIPLSRTDGIEIVDARMDGTRFPVGDGPGQIRVTSRNRRIRIEWQFAPVGPSAHIFELHYVARGVVYREGDRDVLRWRLLPAEHAYAIAESTSTIVLTEGTIEPVRLESRRTGAVSSGPDREGIRVVASDIRSNGWVIADLRFAAGAIVTAIPQWQQRQQDVASLAPRWGIAAAVIFLAGLLTVLTLRQGYSTSMVELDTTPATAPPEPLPAALAAVLASKGRSTGYQGVATLLDLADRGVLEVTELPRTFGARSYELAQVPGRHDLAAHEAAALEIAFGGRGDPVSLTRARGRLARASRRVTAAVNAELAERGLLDPERRHARDRVTVASMVMLLGAALGCVAASPFIPRYDGWPFLLPLGLGVAGIVGIVIAATMTPLSDEGLIMAAQWRGFRRHLRLVAESREDSAPASIESRWIVYGIAVGLGYQWARFLKRHPGAAPPWFVAASADDGAAFATFVGSHAASSSAGAGGAAAAGGGGSGAG